MPLGRNAPKLWPARAGEAGCGWCRRAGPPRRTRLVDLVAEHRPDGAVRRCGSARRARPAPAARAPAAHRRSARRRAPCRGRGPAATRSAAARRPAASGWQQDLREVEAAGLPVRRAPASTSRQSARPTISSSVRKPSSAMQLAHFLGDEAEEVDDVLGLAGEARAQLRILRGDADRAGVEVAVAHHDAAQRDQRRGGEAELLGAEQRARSRRRGRSSAGRRPGRRCGCAGRSAPAPAASRPGPAPRARRRA